MQVRKKKSFSFRFSLEVFQNFLEDQTGSGTGAMIGGVVGEEASAEVVGEAGVEF